MTMSAREFLHRMKTSSAFRGKQCAGNCGTTLATAITGRQRTADGDMCDDCYFERLGEVVEQCPPRAPRRGRGQSLG